MTDSVIQFEGTIYENGYGLIAQRVMRDKVLPKQSKLIYAYMCSFAGVSKTGDRTAFPSISLQCNELGMTEDTYYKWRKPLIDKGYIKITKQRKEGAKFDNNIYSIMAVPVEVKTEEKPHPKKQGMDEKPYPKKSSTEKSSTEKSGTNSNIFNSNIFKKEEEEEEEDNFQLIELISLFNQNISVSNPIIENKISCFLEHLSFEVIKREIETCAMYGAKTWSYVEAALYEDVKLGINSIEQLENKYKNFKSKTKNKSSVYNKKLIRTEQTPHWLEGKQEDSAPTIKKTSSMSEEEKTRIREEALKMTGQK